MSMLFFFLYNIVVNRCRVLMIFITYIIPYHTFVNIDSLRKREEKRRRRL